MTGSEIRDKLRGGERIYGTQIASLMTPVAAARMCSLPLDFAFFCTEHIPLDPSEISMLCQLYAASGISPIVRVPCPDANAISRAMDAGAQGIVVPYVETVEEVRLAVGAVKYRPLKGRLLEDVLNGRRPLSEKTRGFLDGFNREQYLIVGIESVPAIENLEALLDSGEVDGVFLGPHDISISMDIANEYENPQFTDAVESIIRCCRRHSVGVGLHMQLGRQSETLLRRLYDAGMNFIINGSDIAAMHEAMSIQLRRLRELGKDLQNERDLDRRKAPVPVSCVQ